MTVDLDKIKVQADRVTNDLIGASAATDTPADRYTNVAAITNIHQSLLRAVTTAKHCDTNTVDWDNACQDARHHLAQLQGMARSSEVAKLDRAATVLAGITTVVTGLFTAFGFGSGDYQRMFRDLFIQSFLFLIFTGAALFLGTFAFVVNAQKSDVNLWVERIAVYVGIGCAGAALVLGSWGLSQGQSAGPTRPGISATINTSGTSQVLDVTSQSAAVPRWEHLKVTIWAKDARGWNVLRDDIVGPGRDGTVNDSIAVPYKSSYIQVVAAASLESGDKSGVPSQPPPACFSEDGTAAPPDFEGSCVLLDAPPSASRTNG